MPEEPPSSAETAPIPKPPLAPNKDPRILDPQTKFKTGDAVRSVTGSPNMILGTVNPEHTMNDQVECNWIDDDGKGHATLFFLGQLALLSEVSSAEPFVKTESVETPTP